MSAARVLIIGEKYREVSAILTTEVDNFPLKLTFVSESEFDWRLVSYYLSFDGIICPYRIQLLHLSFARSALSKPPALILATGASSHTDQLVSGCVCDVVIRGSHLDLFATFLRMKRHLKEQADHMLDAWQISQTVLDLGAGHLPIPRACRPTDDAILQFIMYLRSDWHGTPDDWYKLPKEQAMQLAREAYDNKVTKLVREQGLMYIKPVFGVAETKAPRGFSQAFMLMAFSEQLTRVYKDVIVPALAAINVTVRRADDFFSVGHIMTDIWHRINEAEFVIADLTSRNANVFYELGIAHTLGKPVILLSQTIDDVPFDVRDQRVILYGTRYDEIATLQEGLQRAVESLRQGVRSA